MYYIMITLKGFREETRVWRRMRDIVQAFISLIHRYPLLKYDNSSPMAFIGLDLLDKSDTTPKLTSILLSRPSHIKETS